MQDKYGHTLAQCFYNQVVKSPIAIAVQYGDQCLSYEELDQRSNCLAHYLVSCGVIPGARVGIAIDRNLQLPVAVLAVLKAGAAYVPFDPTYPKQRLQMMANDSQVHLILASPGYTGLFGLHENVQDINAINHVLADFPIDAIQVDTDIGALGYLVYTSGSTGQPKGVAMSQKALLNLIIWQLQQPDLGLPARTLQFTPLSFDVHFQEFFSTWLSGGVLILIDDSVRRDAIGLLTFINDHDIERLFLPFVALQHLAEAAISYGPLPTSLKHIVTAGEQLQVNRYIIEFFSSLPQCLLHNHYGPSETHVVTSYTLSGEPTSWDSLPPIGVPIANTRVYIVDEHIQQLPRGEPGEICIAGDCLAEGYWQRPELTAERFILDRETGERLYRTGDLGMERSDGSIDYLGRIDGQVKIRGHRIETGEIETAIIAHPLVKSSAVLATGQLATDKKLVAYLVLGAGKDSVTTLMQNLRNEQLSQWQQVWDGTYSLEPSVDPEFDISGWNSSYTGEPLSASDMRCWVEGTVRSIRRLEPTRVLEIGCGTGLIMYNLAPHCDYYHGTDFSPIAIKKLEHHLAEHSQRWPQCYVSVMAAEEMDSLADKAFDTVVINSVTQHFPGIDYLFTVIQSACNLLQAGGSIFLGDITSALSREAFFTELELYRSQLSNPLQALRASLEKNLGDERELVIAPELFYRLPELFPAISSVDIQLKPGRYENELARFRYDVVLHIAGVVPALDSNDITWLAWQNDVDTVTALPAFITDYLQQQLPEIIGLANIPNRRLSDAFIKAALLDDEQLVHLSDLQQRFSSSRLPACDPQDFWDLESSLPYVFNINISSQGKCFDVVARRLNDHGEPLVENFQYLPDTSGQSVSCLASEPLNATIMPDVVKQLRKQLGSQLPEYMLPQRYVLLSRLPMTPSGKLNRRALPLPGNERPVLEQEYIPAKTGTEKKLAGIWQEILELERVGVNDNFFDLGGSSILSLKVGIQIKLEFTREVAVVTLFQYPTIRTLAGYLDGDEGCTDIKKIARTRAKKQQNALAIRGRKNRKQR